MDELVIKDEQPLLIVKYEPLKIMWRIFFPYSFWCLIGLLAGGSLVSSESIANNIVGVFFYGVGLMGLYLIMDLLMLKGFYFYPDRVVKVSKLFGQKEMKYADSILGISLVKMEPIFNSLSAYSFYKKVMYSNIHIRYTGVGIDRRMISKNTENQIMDFVSKLLNQDIREQHKHSNILNFDIKNYLGEYNGRQ